MTYAVESVAYSDAPGVTETMMRAMWKDPHYRLQFRRGLTVEELIADSGLRIPYNLSRNRDHLRHQKVVNAETGQVVGYARWELPETEWSADAWLDAQMPPAPETQQRSLKDDFDSTQEDGKRKIFNYEFGDYISPALGKAYDELVEGGGPSLVLDFNVCHPAHQRHGVASMLLEQGQSQARKLGIKRIIVMTGTDPAGPMFYEKHGFRNFRTVTQDDSKWGGTTPHVTCFLEKEV